MKLFTLFFSFVFYCLQMNCQNQLDFEFQEVSHNVFSKMYEVIDFDNDGDEDVITKSIEGWIVLINSDGKFDSKIKLNVGNEEFLEIFPVDIDLDGDIDLIGRGYNYIASVKQEEDFNFVIDTLRHDPSHYRDFAVGDFDSDGYPDVVLTIFDAEAGLTEDVELSVIRNNSGNSFLIPESLGYYYSAGGVESIDSDNDGVPEILFNYHEDYNFFDFLHKLVLFNYQNDNFIGEIIYSSVTPGMFPSNFMTTENFDGDEDDDIKIFNFLWLENNFGIFSPNFSLPSDLVSLETSFFDINQDGEMDAVSIESGSESLNVYLGSEGSLYEVEDGLVFNSYEYSSNESYYRSIRNLDVNQDDYEDFMVYNVGVNQLHLYTNNGDGSFAFEIVSPSSYKPLASLEVDFDNDNDLDIITLSVDSGSITLYESLGISEEYRIVQKGIVKEECLRGKFSDVSGDGIPDLIILTNDYKLKVIKSLDWFVFDEPILLKEGVSNFLSGNIPEFEMIDLNQDGFNDIVCNSGQSNPDLIAFINDGSFNFAETELVEIDGPFRFVLEDLNFDSYKDIVIRTGVGSFDVYYNEPLGLINAVSISFDIELLPSVTFNPYEGRIGDFKFGYLDQDNNLDLCFSYGSGEFFPTDLRLSWAVNNGGLNFSQESILSELAGEFPLEGSYEILLEDFNLDGYLDVISNVTELNGSFSLDKLEVFYSDEENILNEHLILEFNNLKITNLQATNSAESGLIGHSLQNKSVYKLKFSEVLTSISEFEVLRSVKVYPNPSSELFKIESNYEITDLNVFSLSGVEVNHEFDIKNGTLIIPNHTGVVALRINLVDGNSITKMIVLE